VLSLPEFHSSRLDRRQDEGVGAGFLARHERDFRSDAEEPLGLNELLELLDASGIAERDRENAIACYLSAGEGWREAMQKISGAFAEGESGLRERKAD
jgi:hypothetical protein